MNCPHCPACFSSRVEFDEHIRKDHTLSPEQGTDLVERLREAIAEGAGSLAQDCIDMIERLQERCEAYKGQVKAGAAEITRLRGWQAIEKKSDGKP